MLDRPIEILIEHTFVTILKSLSCAEYGRFRKAYAAVQEQVIEYAIANPSAVFIYAPAGELTLIFVRQKGSGKRLLLIDAIDTPTPPDYPPCSSRIVMFDAIENGVSKNLNPKFKFATKMSDEVSVIFVNKEMNIGFCGRRNSTALNDERDTSIHNLAHRYPPPKYTKIAHVNSAKPAARTSYGDVHVDIHWGTTEIYIQGALLHTDTIANHSQRSYID